MWPEPDPDQERALLRVPLTPGGNAAFHNFPNDFSHILDPNQRRRLALSEIDKIPFGWYHVRAVAVAGAGFFADSYDLFAINLAVQMLGISFWGGDGGTMPTILETAIKAATSGGAIIGQVVFGWLADMLGRKRMYGVELIILVVATLGQSLSSPSSAITITGLLIFGRVVMGLGIGGDYPMSAIIISEFAPTRWRGAMMAAVFSMQGGGQFAAALVALLTTIGFRKSFSTASDASTCIDDCQLAANQAWRIIIGVGALPAVFALYYRITIPETPRFTFDVAKDIEKADADIRAYIDGEPSGHPDALKREQTKLISNPLFTQPRASWSDFSAYFSKWRNGSVLFATMASWFFVDLAFYGLGLNNSTVLSVIGYSSGSNVYQLLYNTAVGNLILVCAGSIPGYWLSILTVDYLGRKPIQIGGFVILTIIFCIIGFGYNSLAKPTLLALYILAQFFFNFGPNTMTFIVPGECFPTRYRSTCHGLSAASGKLGATIAQIMAQPLLKIGAAAGCKGSACSPWLDHLMEIFACFMLCGTIVSVLIPETKRKTLEMLAGEAPFRKRDSGATNREKKDGISVLGRLPDPVAWPYRETEVRKKDDNRSGERDDGVQSKKRGSSNATSGGRKGSQPHMPCESESSTGTHAGEGIALRDVGALLG